MMTIPPTLNLELLGAGIGSLPLILVINLRIQYAGKKINNFDDCADMLEIKFDHPRRFYSMAKFL